MLAGLAAEQQPAGHAKVKDHVTGAAKGQQNELAVAFHLGDAPPHKLDGDPVRIGAAKNARAANFHRQNAPPDDGLERPGYGFDFGKFRHGQERNIATDEHR